MSPDHHPLGRSCRRAFPKALLMTVVVLVRMALGQLPKSW